MADEINISADETTVNDILTRSHRFEVPDYQRQYSWTEEQWAELWEDLNSLEEGEMHFLGSIVVVSGAYEPTGSTKLQLVDGQQRLSTISILLCALRTRYSELEENNAVDQINDKYLRDRGFEETYPRISLGRLDHQDYIKVIEGKHSKVSQNKLLRESYEYFYSKVESYTLDELNVIRDKLLNRMSIVMIRSNSESSAFRLFETLNDRGLELSAVDLMKNYLLSVAHQDSNVDSENIKEDWEQILLTIRNVDKPVRLFRHYIMSTPDPKTERRVTESRVYDRFKSLVDGIQRRDNIDLETFVADMESQARLYVGISNATIQSFSPQQNRAVNDRLIALSAIGATPARTLMLRTFYELDDPARITKILELIESLMLRWNVSRYSTGSEIDKLFSRLCHRAFVENDPVDYIRYEFQRTAPSDEEFERNFAQRSHRQNDQTKYILDTIERKHFMVSGEGKEIADRSKVHIEHVAPRRTFSAKKYDPWIDYLDVDEQTFSEYRNRIGNLTLFEQRLNIRASNSPFEQKKDYYLDSDFEMTRALCENEEWSIGHIDDRSRELAFIAKDIWSF